MLDIEAVDEAGRTFQVEMQRRAHRGVRQRMLYDWARLYSGQLERKQPYTGLRSVVSVWVCEDDVFPESSLAHLRFEVRERVEGRVLHEDLRVDFLQLSRWNGRASDLLGSPVALNALYRGRIVAERLEAQRQLDEAEVQAIRDALERERAAKEAERAEKEAERAAKEAALAQRAAALAQSEAERAAKEAALAQIAELKKRLGLDEV